MALPASPVPILVYHSVSRRSSEWLSPYTVSPEVFAQHLDLIVDQGRTSLTVSELVALRRRRAVPDRSVVITFDDGYADFADFAMPLLAERGLKSTLYVTTGFLRGAPRTVDAIPPDEMLDWSHLPSLAAAGVELGAHGHTHDQLDTLSPPRARSEITRSRDLLEGATGQPAKSFAYPHGFSSPRVRRLVAEAGFTSACAVRNSLSPPNDDVWRLARLMVLATTAPGTFQSWLTGSGASVAKPGEALQTRLWRAWRRGRALATRRPGSEIPDGTTVS